MATYLKDNVVLQLVNEANEIRKSRQRIMDEYGIDMTENDTMNNLHIFKIVQQYDPTFRINFSRNGEDAQSDGISDIELKTTTVTPLKRGGYGKASFAFHAMGKLQHQSYMFVGRCKTTALPYVIFDIRAKENVEIVYKKLSELSDEWYNTKAKVKKTSYDVIHLNEEFMHSNIKFNVEIIDGVKVFKDYA